MAREIFTDIPEYTKQQAAAWFELAFRQPDAIRAVNMLKEYRDSCLNDREREFVDFYFNMKMEEMRQEN